VKWDLTAYFLVGYFIESFFVVCKSLRNER
jgi:hypothetical protein